jgi:TonB-dependent receptor
MRTLRISASALALAVGLAAPGVAAAQAQPQTTAPDAAPPAPADDQAASSGDIVVTGVRASLERSIAIKRNSNGIVDAISAEDIGKFPNTNLAESLQRITGVSIDRVNGEGSTVTVRGFGAQYNLVTLNGRQLATSNIVSVGGDQGGDGAGGFGRSFDFANLAAEGVKTLEVYKTGRAAVPSGGIGAAINVVTRRPLDARQGGFTGTIGAKASYDTSADDCISCGSHVTPEVSGLLSWSDNDQKVGVSLFGSYQKRNFTVPTVASDDWNIRTLSDFLNTNNGFVNGSTKLNNVPTNSNVLVSVPNDSRYHFSEDSRERLNGQAMLQFRPTDGLTITADGMYAQLRASERRSTQSNWFNRPFDEVTFDDASNGIATTSYLHETINGVKDEAFEQAYRAQKNRLWDVGLNLDWQATDRLKFVLDGHLGKAESLPDNPNGQTSTTVAFNLPVVTSHSLTTTPGGFPQQTLTFSDCAPSFTPNGTPFIKGNCNNKLDAGDLSGAIQRQFASTQTQRIKELRLDGTWDLGGGSKFDFGGGYRTTNTLQTQYNTRQVLGDWGNSLPPEINAVAPGQVFQFCTACQFTHNNPNADANTLVAWRTEDATKLYNTLYQHYIGITNDGVGHQNNIDANNYNRVKESIWSVYGQVTWNGNIGNMPAQLVAGARFESTKVTANSLQPVPLAIVWQADNDFNVLNSTDRQALSSKGSYNNLLPSMDFSIDLTSKLKGRFSYSKTIARAPYGSLFASASVQSAPPRPTAIGGVATGFSNNTDLDPLDSDNFDVSLEWYPNKDSYFSVGFFDKRVHNFIGNTLVNRSLFGLRDPTSGAPGTRSGTAKDQLTTLHADITDVNLFTYTALLQQNNGNVAAATAAFQANYHNGALDQAFVDATLGAVDILADANDPLFNFAVNTPINNKDAEIYGVEIAGQYFFGRTGFGVAASYTLVRGDVGIDVAANPNVDQFALVGLSDTANVTLIYEKYGISARLAYNWRAKFLSQLNRDSYHNPVYTAPYGQLDLNVSYDITKNIAVSFEGINLTEEGVRTYGRDPSNTWYLAEGSARYLVGARFKF